MFKMWKNSNMEPKSIHTWLEPRRTDIYEYGVDVCIEKFPVSPSQSWLYFFSLQVNFTEDDEWGHGADSSGREQQNSKALAIWESTLVVDRSRVDMEAYVKLINLLNGRSAVGITFTFYVWSVFQKVVMNGASGFKTLILNLRLTVALSILNLSL